MSTSKVEYKAMGHARWELPLDLPNGAPDTVNPEYPEYGTVRPNSIGLGLMPNAQTGVWEVTALSVIGPKVKDGKVVTKRDYGVMFVDPMDEDSAAPEWVKEICQEWTDRANGISTNSPARGDGPAAGLEQQVARAIKEAQETLEKDSRDLADRYEAWSHHPFDHSQASIESSRIASHAELLAQAAARLEGMREVARMLIAKEG